MKCRMPAVVVGLLFLASCGQHQQLKAKIFERRELGRNRLKIRYEYVVNNKLYRDSATIANIVINADSIPVIIDPSNPGKSIPDFSK